MRRVILILVLLISFNFLEAKISGFENETDFFDGIKSYKEIEGYLKESEEKVLEGLREKTLKVGYSSDNNIDAFALKKILEKHLDIHITLIKRPWNLLIEGVRTGEIDIISNLSYTRERSKDIEYTKDYYTDNAYLVYPEHINLESMDNLKNKKLIFLNNSVYLENLISLKDDYEVILEPKESFGLDDIKDDTFVISGRTELYSMGKKGTLDLKYKDFFKSTPIHFGITKKLAEKERELLKEVFDNYICEKVFSFLGVYHRYLEDSFIKKITNDIEADFFDAAEVIYIGLDSEQYYMSYREEDETTIKGAVVEITSILKRVIKNKEYIEVKTLEDKKALLNSKHNSMVLLPITLKNIKEYKLSGPVYSMEYFLIKDKYNKRSSDSNITGVPKSSYYLDVFLFIKNEKNYKIFDSTGEAVDALEEGSIESIILSENDIKYFQNEKLKTFLDIQMSVANIDIGLATNKNNEILTNFINKFIDYVSIKNIAVKKWKHAPNLIGIEYKAKIKQLRILICILASLMLLLFVVIKKLYRYNYYDDYTRLPNIKLLINSLKDKENSGLITFSVENLSEIIDSFSEEEALESLKKVISDLPMPVYYISKNQYAMFSSGMNQWELILYVKRMVKNLKSHSIGNTRVELSYGVSHMSTSKNPEDLIKNAIYSLHLFSQNKKIIVGEPKTLEEHRSYKKLERELEEALVKDRFIPYFQPKFDVKSGRVKGAEILSRYTNEKGEFISPGTFIPILENLGIIDRLDLQILKKSLLIIKDLLDRGKLEKYFVISQNLSVKSLEDKRLYKRIREIIEEVDFPIENLEFEVTETAVSQDLKRITANLNQIRSLGVSISLDDFSAGNSSVRYINCMPLNIIKFDMSILPKSEDELASIGIFTALYRAFKDLGYEIVAEGVETEWQSEFIKRTGVDTGQGYYYSKPLDSEAFKEYMNP